MSLTVFRGMQSSCEALARFVNHQSILLVTGDTSYKRCGAKQMLEQMLARSLGDPVNCLHIRHTGILLTLDELDVHWDRIRRESVNRVVAVGGGSVLDTAKILSLALACEKAPSSLISHTKERSVALAVFAVPTTAGSGAEATQFAVAYANGQKLSIDCPPLRPAQVALIPDLTASMTPYQTACTGYDAIAQSIEALWANSGTKESRAYAFQALRQCECFEEAISQPTPEIRRRMQEGAYLAGCAINIARTTAAHALSYYLTSHFSVPHGHAVAMVLPYVAEWNLAHCPNDAARRFFDRFNPRQFPLLDTLPSFCAARGIDFKTLAVDLLSHVDSSRLVNNPVDIGSNLFEPIDKKPRYDES